MIKPDKQDRSITLNGLDYIDVPALGRKDYKLNFYTYKEGSFSAKVSKATILTCSFELAHRLHSVMSKLESFYSTMSILKPHHLEPWQP